MTIPELYEIQKQFIKDCSFVIENNKIGIFSSPTGTGKTLSLLLSIKNFISEINEEDDFLESIFDQKIIKKRIYYCSRTHSQLRQVVNEFKKLQINTRGIVLSSRKGYCINNEVDKLASIEVINSKCKDLVLENKCKFYVEHHKDKGVYSIEDLVKDSRTYNYCPYYFSKEYFKKSEIVFLPYNMLFSEDTRKSLEINLDNSIVIVDEAHNIIDTVSQINTALIQIDDLKRYILMAEKYKKKVLREGSKNSKIVNLILEIIKRLISFSSKLPEEKIVEVSDFLLETNLHNFNTLEITEEIKNTRLMLKLENYEKKTNLKLQDITKFLNLLVASDKSSRVECGKRFFKIFPLNSKIFFDPFKNSRSIIFAGGTMEPIDELKGIFDYREVVYYNYQSNKRKFKGFIINKIYDKSIEIKQTTREDKELFTNLNNMILEIINSKEGGTVIFLPSKFYLEVFRSFFDSRNELSCFYEDKDKFEEYVISVRRTKSILFAVIGGTYSEGVNFSDELCRNLIIIGVPYPNLDSEINEKIKMFGFEWYTQVAMKKVNQTIGRAIRHDGDYANIFLVDKRYVKLKKYLSSWVLNDLEINNFENVKEKSRQFLKECAEKDI